MTVIQNDKSAFLLTLHQIDGEHRIRLAQVLHDETGLLAETVVRDDAAYLKVTGDYLDYRFYYSTDGEEWHQVGDVVDGAALSPYFIDGFNYTGVYLGLYASANGNESENYADYEFFHYRSMEKTSDDWYHRQEAQRRAD